MSSPIRFLSCFHFSVPWYYFTQVSLYRWPATKKLKGVLGRWHCFVDANSWNEDNIYTFRTFPHLGRELSPKPSAGVPRRGRTDSTHKVHGYMSLELSFDCVFLCFDSGTCVKYVRYMLCGMHFVCHDFLFMWKLSNVLLRDAGTVISWCNTTIGTTIHWYHGTMISSSWWYHCPMVP